jgi:hypothetical protein
MGGKVLCIIRRMIKLENIEEVDKHPVENQLRGYGSFYETIHNDGTIEELNNSVETVLSMIAEK